MANSFIKKITQKILNCDISISNQVIIVPSERSKIYIEKDLLLSLKKSFILPQIYTIDEFIFKLSPISRLSTEQALFILYDIHCALQSNLDEDKSFEEFLLWANTLLNDFDEIDRFLVSSNDLFKNLKDVKNIEQWSFSEDSEISESKKQYLEFWNKIPKLYDEFQKKCIEIKCALPGTIYKNVNLHLFELLVGWEQNFFYFFGLNALSNAEISIIKKLISQKKAEFYVDADLYYVEKEKHEAGYFIRKLVNEFGKNILDLCENSLSIKSIDIEMFSCPQNTGQVKLISDIMINENFANSDDLLLLADEDLINSVFQNIPSEVEKANITLGLPLRLTPIKTWVELLIHIQEGFLKINKNQIYYNDLINCWNHLYFQSLLNDNEKQQIYIKENNIIKYNRIFISLKSIEISEKLDILHKFIFTPWENNWILALENIRKINEILFENINQSEELERASIFKFDKQISVLQSVFEEYNTKMKLDSFSFLIQSVWNNQNISYFGNPTEGLQVMGLLETRLLNFNRICIVGMNEGKLPSSLKIQSHIPMDLRHFFLLPNLREKEAVFAQHFYRLLQYCSKLYITYFNGISGFSQTEKSRYLYQLELELAKDNPNIKIKNNNYSLKNVLKNTNKIVKNEDYYASLDNFCENGISASKLKKYFNCPLDFYYQVILGLGEQEDVEEELEVSSFGSIVHEVLQKLYENYIDKYISIKDYEKMINDYPSLIKNAFLEKFDNDEDAFMQGKNFLSFQMSNEIVKRYINLEKQYLNDNSKSLKILAIEKRMSHKLSLNINGVEKTVVLKGFIDRIDLLDDKIIRIVDYKTGKISSSDLIIKELTKSLLEYCKSSNKKYLLQLITYLYLYNKTENIIADECNLYSLLSSKFNNYTLLLNGVSYKDIIDDYPSILKGLLEDLYDESKPIEHKKNSLYCKYCN